MHAINSQPAQGSPALRQSFLTTCEREAHVMTAVLQLQASERGKNALRALHAFLESDSVTLSRMNQRAVLTLLSAAWDGLALTTLHCIAGVIEAPKTEGGAQ